MKVPGPHGHPGVVAVSPVEEGLPPEPAQQIKLQPQLLEDVLKESAQVWLSIGLIQSVSCHKVSSNFQWMAHGHRGHRGAVAASLVVQDLPQEHDPALLQRLGGNRVMEKVKKFKTVKLGNVQVGKRPLVKHLIRHSLCSYILPKKYFSHDHLVKLGILEQLHEDLWWRSIREAT